MAKSKPAAKRSGGSGRSGTSSRRGAGAAGTRRGVGKGEGLEVGNARREAGTAAGPMRRTATRPARKSPLQLPDEKAVRKTERTVPVEPKRPSPGAREPIPDAALDHRRQVVGTDEKSGRGRR